MTNLIIMPSGDVRFLYDDDLAAALLGLGQSVTSRASDVEPAPGGGWTADMSRVAGPVLGPFQTRGEALLAEREWLEARNLPPVLR